MPFFIPLIVVAATVASSVASGMAAQQAGKDQQTMMDYNAKVEEQRAKQLEAKSLYDQQRQAEAAARGMSSLEAGIGAAGVVSTEGSPLMVMAKQASEYELENLMIGYEGKIGAGAARNQAGLDRLQGDIYARAGRNKAMGSYMGAGSSLLTGFNDMGWFNKKA